MSIKTGILVLIHDPRLAVKIAIPETISGAINIPLNALLTSDVNAAWPSDNEIPTTLIMPAIIVAREAPNILSQPWIVY